jgi:hypothetical protein
MAKVMSDGPTIEPPERGRGENVMELLYVMSCFVIGAVALICAVDDAGGE